MTLLLVMNWDGPEGSGGGSF